MVLELERGKPILTHSSYPTVNLPEAIFDKIIDEMLNLAGWVMECGRDKYYLEVREFINELEKYRGSPTTAREEK